MDTDAVRTRLHEEEQRLRTDLQNLQSEADSQKESLQELSVVDQHPADIGTETFEMEKNASIIESVQAQLRDVAEALERVEDGSYGLCQTCQKPIGDERLEALPAARYCMEHQELVEGSAGG